MRLAVFAVLALLATGGAHALPLGLPDVMHPGDATTAARVALGKALFFDARLSADGTISCASCHRPADAYTDGNALSLGIGQRVGTRNAPSLVNVAFAGSLTWDGRHSDLEDQVLDPFVNPVEHGLPDTAALIARVRAGQDYSRAFAIAFPESVDRLTAKQIAVSIAAYLRTLVAGDSPVDRYLYGREQTALSPAAIRGLEVFRGAGDCARCHRIGERYALLTDDAFHAPGIGREIAADRFAGAARRAATAIGPKGALILTDSEVAALGRFVVTGQPGDIGKFRTPSLRNVALTAPYMHDGSVPTLAQAVEREVYYRGLDANRPLALSVGMRQDLVEFLRSLTSPALP
jgi:cytochrome c peroxidase